MNPPPGIEPQNLQQILLEVREQIATALLLSAGMVCAVASVACTAFGRRRISLFCGLLYSLTLCFVHNGHSQILGPLGCAASLLGFWWPGRKGGP
jgi:4-amino-4-deoxy-L-arabinose transferase-like glycosyltransferase